MAKLFGKKPAIKKPVSKLAVGKPRPKMEVNSFDKQMSDLAAKQAEANKRTSGAAFISTAGGEFSIDDQVVESGKISVIILDSLFVNTFYEGPYVPNQPTTPDCYAYGDVEAGMEPHDEAENKQSDNCADCPLNVYGSGQGKGKACKNQRRLAVVLEEEFNEDGKTARILMLNVAPTSIAAFAGYVQEVTAAYERPTSGLVTEISIFRPKGKTYGLLEFAFDRELKSSELKNTIPRIKEAKSMLEVPYPKFEDEGEDKKKPAPKKASAGASKFKPKTATAAKPPVKKFGRSK